MSLTRSWPRQFTARRAAAWQPRACKLPRARSRAKSLVGADLFDAARLANVLDQDRSPFRAEADVLSLIGNVTAPAHCTRRVAMGYRILDALVFPGESVRLLRRKPGLAVERRKGLVHRLSFRGKPDLGLRQAEFSQLRLAKNCVSRLVPHMPAEIEVEIPGHIRRLEQH